MVAPVHKNTNAALILIVCDVIFCKLTKHITALRCAQDNSGVKKSVGHLDKLFEIADYVLKNNPHD